MIPKGSIIVKLQKRCEFCSGAGKFVDVGGLRLPVGGKTTPPDAEVETCRVCHGEGWLEVDDMRGILSVKE